MLTRRKDEVPASEKQEIEMLRCEFKEYMANDQILFEKQGVNVELFGNLGS